MFWSRLLKTALLCGVTHKVQLKKTEKWHILHLKITKSRLTIHVYGKKILQNDAVHNVLHIIYNHLSQNFLFIEEQV